MRPEIIKSKTDPQKYLIALIIASIFLSTNIIGWNKFIYSHLDYIFSPFLIMVRNSGMKAELFLTEIQNRSSVTEENLELKKKIAEYDQIIAENKDLKNQIKSIESENNIVSGRSPKLVSAQIFGVQNMYSSNPKLKLIIPDGLNVKKGDPVYYDRLTLLGFITGIEGATAIIAPFYSPGITGFNIPVQSLDKPEIKGFVNRINQGEITVRNIPKDASIQNGEIWVTTNDVFEVPPGLIIGKVKNVRENLSTGFKEIELSLTFDLSNINYVYLRDE